MKTLGSTDDLAAALAEVGSSSGTMPTFVPPEERDFLNEGYLDEATVNAIREAGPDSRPYKIYLAWRRRASVRLWAQGLTQAEIGEILGISQSSVADDIAKVRAAYQGVAKRDWALLVEERLLGIDSDISMLRSMMERKMGKDTDAGLRILDRIMALETRRDKLLGIDKAAASQFTEKKALSVTLSFDNNHEVEALPMDIEDAEVIE